MIFMHKNSLYFLIKPLSDTVIKVILAAGYECENIPCFHSERTFNESTIVVVVVLVIICLQTGTSVFSVGYDEVFFPLY